MTPSASADGRRAFTRDARGSAAVEFAFVGPVLITMILGMIMLGMAYYEGASVQWSLERSLRAAMIDPDMSAADIEAFLNEELETMGSPEVDFSYVIDDSGSVPVAVATANYDVPLNIPFVPDLNLHFSAENVSPVPEG